jgi:hypothetical protein
MITIPLDMGPSSFRCPICDTLYIIDPLQEGSLETGFSVTEVEGHRLEKLSGEIAQSIVARRSEAEKFFSMKIGGLERAYVARASGLTPTDILKKEMEIANSMMQSFRPDKPFTRLEQALGLLAFAHWLEIGEGQYDSMYFTAPNDSARLVTIQFVENMLSEPETRRLLQAKVNSFNPEQEVKWAKEKANHSQWTLSLTRAVIMLCRALAYRYTGLTVSKSTLLNQMSLAELKETALELYSQAYSTTPDGQNQDIEPEQTSGSPPVLPQGSRRFLGMTITQIGLLFVFCLALCGCVVAYVLLSL